jgi:two-component system response regulator HupR/HoxA
VCAAAASSTAGDVVLSRVPGRRGGEVAVRVAEVAATDLTDRSRVDVESGELATVATDGDVLATGADAAAPGLFEEAHEGTLFLDEIGAMPLDLQAKLLRVLETGELRRLGGTETIHVKVRTVAASNADLRAMAAAGTFREDLFYRIAGVEIALPPLRERLEDVPALFDHFLDHLCSEQEIDRPEVQGEVIDRLQAYPWPGNVRELRNEVERLLALQRGVITPALLSLPVFSGDPEAVPPTQLPPGGLKELVETLERRVIVDTMIRAAGNKTRAATMLSLSRLGLRKKIERYGIDSSE